MQGILRGFDPFMNVVVDETVEICKDGKKNDIGMVVSAHGADMLLNDTDEFFNALSGDPRQQHYHGRGTGADMSWLELCSLFCNSPRSSECPA